MSELSAEAKTILIEAAKEGSSGTITCLQHSGGYQITIGGGVDLVDGPRSRAAYEAALEELKSRDPVLITGGETHPGTWIYSLTKEGYEQADVIDLCGGSEEAR